MSEYSDKADMLNFFKQPEFDKVFVIGINEEGGWYDARTTGQPTNQEVVWYLTKIIHEIMESVNE